MEFMYIYNITVFIYSFLFDVFKNSPVKLNTEIVFSFPEELKPF